MFAIGPVLKMLGISVTEEQIKQVEDLIPKIPSLVNNFISVTNEVVRQADARLQALEQSNIELSRKFDALVTRMEKDALLSRAESEQTNGNRRPAQLINGHSDDANSPAVGSD